MQPVPCGRGASSGRRAWRKMWGGAGERLTISIRSQWAAQQANVILACVTGGLPCTSNRVK